MERVFTKVAGNKVEQNGELVSVRLTDSNGNDERIFLSPDLLEDLAHSLLTLKAGPTTYNSKVYPQSKQPVPGSFKKRSHSLN